LLLGRLSATIAGSEDVLYSNRVDKINRKGKSQTRVLLITDRGLYNLMPDAVTCKRRIDLKQISSVIVSTTSDQFVIKVPAEYDYHYSSPSKKTIAEILKDARFSMAAGDIELDYTAEPQLASRCLTKVQARAAGGVGRGAAGRRGALLGQGVGARGIRGLRRSAARGGRAISGASGG
jgi:hypothetical protein